MTDSVGADITASDRFSQSVLTLHEAARKFDRQNRGLASAAAARTAVRVGAVEGCVA
jgi:hypothetical protein